MPDNFHIENNGIKANVDLQLPETVRTFKDIIPKTLNAVDRMGASIISVLGFPFAFAQEYSSYIVESAHRKLQKRLEEIPSECLRPASSRMAVPLIQEIFIAADQELLQDMFIQLLASSMNSDKLEFVHPAYISIIKNLSPLDAKILKESTKFKDSKFPAYEIRLQIPGGKSISPEYPSFFRRPTPGQILYQHIINFSSLMTTSNISALLPEMDMITDNLKRQGIINIEQNNEYLVNICHYRDDLEFLFKLEQNYHPLLLRDPQFRGLEFSTLPHIAYLTTLGKHFISCCVPH